ncbi:MAG: hypothetical protein KAG64_04490 [Bacteroidales bacterium]|nr:hypothetical protein [Bacteroidales bacterium]
MADNYQILISKIDAFIRKYYSNMLLKGLLISLGIIISFFLIINILEHFFYLSTLVRAILFYIFIITNSAIVVFWIIIPLTKLISFGKRINHEQAASIIGKHFPEVSDSLLNTLQLKQLVDNSNVNKAILEASIEQRSQRLSPIPFHTAIKFSVNKRYLKFTLPPLFFLLFLLLYSPDVITKSSQRIINYETKFVEQAPYSFEIQNDELSAMESADFELKVKIIGEIIPNEVFIVVDGYPFKAKKTTNTSFTYTFNKVHKTINFHFQSGKYHFHNHELVVHPKPLIVGFSIQLNYPKYIGKKNEKVANIGDLLIPEGTKVSWTFNTRDTKNLLFLWDGKAEDCNTSDLGVFQFEKRVSTAAKYQVVINNEFVKTPDTLNYNLDVVPDVFPLIRVEEFKDSVNDNLLYFKGFIKDDYGFKKLQFVYEIKPKDSNTPLSEKQVLPIVSSDIKQEFYHFINLQDIELKPGEEISYYFQVWDNDAVNGSKSSKSRLMVFRVPTIEELDKSKNERAEQLKEKMTASKKKAQKINKEMDVLSKKLAEKKKLDWQDKEALKNLLDEYNKLIKDLEELQKQNKQNQQKDQSFSKEDERILEKQEELNKLMDKLLTPEMKKMMEEMRKMMEEDMKKEDAQKMLDKIKLENKDIEKQLDRDLEIFKQMEFDLKLQEAIDKLKDLQKKQEELGKKSEDKRVDKEELKKEQDALNKEFKKFEKKMEEAKKANSELEKPNSMEDTKKEQEQIKEEQQKSSEQLQKGKKGAASKLQKSASKSMKKLSDKLEKMQSEMEQESAGENMETLRDILANLIESSFNQEELMNEVINTSNTDPKYPKLIHRQKQIREDMQMIEDSLLALSKRQASIAPIVNKEIAKINSGIDQTLRALLDLNTIGPTSRRQKDLAAAKQQYTMTSMNNLALMLAEALDQMKKQQMNPKSGKGSCKKPKPGQSGSSMKSIRKMQQALNKKMKEMQEQMKKGKSKGQQKGDKKNGKGQGEKMSEEMARMAAQQEAIRKKLQDYQNELKKQGRGEEAQGLNSTAKKMEQNETDLVNKILRAESMKRQQEIETRLLEAEKAERKRGEEEKRKSEEGNNKNINPNIEYFDYIRKQNKEVELLKTIPPKLKPFFKKRVNKYFEDIDTN